MKLKTITILFAFLIVAIIVLADRNEIGYFGFIYDYPNGDKVGHFVLFGILSFLFNLSALRGLRSQPPLRTLLTVTLLLAFAIGLEEWSQRFFPERTSDWWDLLASYLGVAVGAWGAYQIGK